MDFYSIITKDFTELLIKGSTDLHTYLKKGHLFKMLQILHIAAIQIVARPGIVMLDDTVLLL